MKFKKKKSRRMRASTFHGYGRGAAHHKGSGNRGGKGRAGSGKKSDGKKPSFWKEVEGGRHGFNSNSRFKIKAINVNQVQNQLNDFVISGAAQKSGSGYTLDLAKAGYNKLLATGTLSESVSITVDYASKNANDKVKSAGGSLTVLKTKVKKVKKKASIAKKKIEAEDKTDEE